VTNSASNISPRPGFDAIDMLEPYVPAYKNGSGEIDWLEALERMAQRQTGNYCPGASTIGEVQRRAPSWQSTAVGADAVFYQLHRQLENYDHIHPTCSKPMPPCSQTLSWGCPITRGNSTVLGAVTLGARIERHFTDATSAKAPITSSP
jgi:N-acetylneuraminate synthase